MADAAPLIVTVRINKEAFLFFSELRKIHFPPERNYLEAHLTLFHHLPGTETVVIEAIRNVAANQPIITMQVTAVVCIGQGVAYKINSGELSTLHYNLQQQWKAWLTPQDKQRLWPHITVQNKVPPPIARRLQQELSSRFQPFEIKGKGFCLWEYAGGPWKFLQDFPFQEIEDNPAYKR